MQRSIVQTMQNGHNVEVGVVGREGMVGIAAFMGSGTALNQTVVQIGNGSLRMPVSPLVEEFRRGGALHDVLLRYAHSLYGMATYVAACNRLHQIDERLARWLLMCQDRARTETLALTQELLGQMLGAERQSVTVAALTLQEMELINYARGRITILDRQGLEAAACECYSAISGLFDGTLES